ncbi:hypothetical protein [Thermococcus sp.]
MKSMGAIDAFSKTITMMTSHRNLILLIMVFTLILAPISTYLVGNAPELSLNQTQTAQKQGNVIFEEHGSTFPEKDIEALKSYLPRLLLYALLVSLLMAAVQYAVIKGAHMVTRGEEYSLRSLLSEGFRHLLQVFAVNLIFGIIAAIIIFLPLMLIIIPVAVGALSGTGGVLLFGIFLILMVEFFVALFIMGLLSMTVPLYVVKGNIGAAFEAFGLAFRNIPSTLGFGALLIVGVLVISMIMAPFSMMAALISPGWLGMLISALLEAPFQALIYALLWIGGLEFYLELEKKREEVDLLLEEFKF